MVAISIGLLLPVIRASRRRRSAVSRSAELPGGDTPFGLEVAQEQQQYVLYLINGAERTRVSDVKVTDGELTATFPGYENTLRAKIKSRQSRRQRHAHQGRRQGTSHSVRREARRGVSLPCQKLDRQCRRRRHWDTTFTNEKGETYQSDPAARASHDRVTGSAMTPTGDHRFLEGQMHGDELQLSTFAGGLAYLYKLKDRRRRRARR
jgi:hypothetical protein